MAILITACIPEGIVLAGDSRQTYLNARGNSRTGSDFGSKVFQLNSRIGVTTFGWAFLQPQNTAILTNIGALIEDFRVAVNPQTTVAEAANLLSQHFQQIYQYDISTLNWNLAPAGQMALGFHVNGPIPAGKPYGWPFILCRSSKRQIEGPEERRLLLWGLRRER